MNWILVASLAVVILALILKNLRISRELRNCRRYRDHLSKLWDEECGVSWPEGKSQMIDITCAEDERPRYMLSHRPQWLRELLSNMQASSNEDNRDS